MRKRDITGQVCRSRVLLNKGAEEGYRLISMQK